MQKLKWIRAVKNHPLAALTAGLIIGTLLSSLSYAEDTGFQLYVPASKDAPVEPTEASPEDIAREFGLPLHDGDDFGSNFGFSKSIPQTRVVRPEQFKDFQLTVDVFRKSSRKPVLREFREEFIPALVPAAEGLTGERARAEAKKRFNSLAKKEFAIVSIRGADGQLVPVKANIISAALEQYIDQVVKGPDGKPMTDPATGQVVTRKAYKTTPPGNYRLDPFAYELKFKKTGGTSEKKPVADPWIRSQTYDNSQMFWGLWITGGYLIHSTPHYGQLGQPASMGCIRQSFPDAMELFTHMVAENLTGMIRIHKLGSDEAVSRLRELVLDAGYTAASGAAAPKDITKDMNWLLDQLRTNWIRINETMGYYGPEIAIRGHDWMGENGKPAPTHWPICGLEGSAIDCFKPWGVKKPKNSAN